MSRLDDVLRGQEDNYILPLYWQRGEEESVIRTEMEKIDAAGIGGVIVEARPHPDYIGERWWKDMDVIMDEARARGMKVWVFDDDHFPTGRAVGRVESAPQELKRLFLREAHMDAIGPAPDASFMVDNWFINPRRGEMSTEGITLVAAVAARRDAQGMRLTGEFINVTDRVQDGVLYWDVPEGRWRVFLLFLTPRGGAAQRVNYLNPIVPESTRILIDTVYEAHYQHYAD
ncbi:MAG: hypothetical protein JW750_09910, partial [Anaerolineaceae bacterium]|nr:hypothetical protein [Anaerolineaceae bacterium]